MADTPSFIAQFRTQPTIFVPAFATRPRVVFAPGSVGSEISRIALASSDNAARKVSFGLARPLTLAASMGTGDFNDNGGSADTITRTAGSFTDDDWKVGDRLLVEDATTLENDFEVILTAVASATLTLTVGGGTLAADEAVGSSTKLMRLAWMWYVDLPSGAGLPSVVAASGLNTTQAPFLDAEPNRLITLGPSDYLVAKLDATLDTGETVDVTVFGADY